MTERTDAERWRRILLGAGSTRPRMRVLGWIIVVGGAILLFWISVPLLVAIYDLPIAVAFAVCTAQCATLPLAVRLPRTAIVVQLAVIVAVGILTREAIGTAVWPLPIANQVVLIALIVLLGLREEWYVPVAAWWSSFLAMALVVVFNASEFVETSEWGVDILITVTLSLLALVLALYFGQRRRVRAALAAARRDIELEQARRETVEERARIARELHDVVAHSMSMVHIQAESARFRVSDVEEARGEFDSIARSARAALREMRDLLAALRTEEDAALYAPQPTIADIPSLAQSARSIGSNVREEVDETDVSAAVSLTAYRIVQEALANIARHAPGADVEIIVRDDESSLEVVVRNGPATSASKPGAEGSGMGLRGMRERVSLLGGEITQEPQPGGGYLISARLPILTRSEAS